MLTLQDIARTFADSFTRKTRADGTPYVTTTDDAPDWVTDVVREAHAGMMPDDWRYACTAAAGEAIADAMNAHDFADGYVDVYNADRLVWLASSLYRAAYVDDAVQDFGGDDLGITDMIGLGQYAEALEVYSLTLSALQAHADADDAGSEGGE